MVGSGHYEIGSLPFVSEVPLVGRELVLCDIRASIFDFQDGGVSVTSDNKVSKACSESRRVMYAPATSAKVIPNDGVVSVDFGGTSHAPRGTRNLPPVMTSI